MKKYRKNKPILIIICFIILISTISLFSIKTIKELNYRKTIEYKLINIGYTKEEINILQEKTNEEFTNNLLNFEYDKMYLEIINEKYYIKEKLNEYINYYKNNMDKKANEIITIINTNTDKDYYTNIKDTDIQKNELMINNKYYKLSKDYKPNDLVIVKNWYSYGENNKLRANAYEAFVNMYEAALKNNIKLIINSSYRTYDEQEKLYNDYLSKYSEKYADSYAARPGHSEHQTGLAIDIITPGSSEENFDKTDAYKWLQDNSYKYGFILRYPKDKNEITGYNYESWHYRYVGINSANIIHENNITFDEYYAYYVENVQNS